MPLTLTPADLGLPAERFPAYRPGQMRAILDVAGDERRWSLLSAPTGAGKSLINVSLTKLLDVRALYLVGTKGLQSQLLPEFESVGMVDIRGHRNYACAIPDAGKYDPTCSLPREKCLYAADVAIAQQAPIVVSNYAYWMSLAKYANPALLGDFDLLIFDEAHTAPDWLADFCTITLNSAEVKTLLNLTLPFDALDDVSAWSAWAADARRVALRRHKEVKESTGNSRSIRLQQILELGRDLAVLASVANSGIEWVAQKANRGARFSPVWAHPYAEQYLFRGIPKIVLCSATLSPEIIRYLGIPKDESRYWEVASGFDPRRRPFIYVPTVRVDRRMNEGQTRIWINQIDSTIDDRLDRKGIIHSRSYSRAQEIVRRSRHSGIMMTHSSRDTRETIERFRRAAAPCVLVSPSVEEGFDFVGDECRFQIIAKIPFIDGRDPVTKARSKQDKGYVNYVAALSLVQMTGRGMRSASDACETFIFDDHWSWFRNKATFASWFRQACVWANEVPPPLDLDAEAEEYDSSRRRSIRERRGRR